MAINFVTAPELQKVLSSMADYWNDYRIIWNGEIGFVFRPENGDMVLIGKIKLEQFRKE